MTITIEGKTLTSDQLQVIEPIIKAHQNKAWTKKQHYPNAYLWRSNEIDQYKRAKAAHNRRYEKSQQVFFKEIKEALGLI